MTFIEDVRKRNQELASVLKQHLGIRKIVEELYPDSAHFIYELLQNADDTGATIAAFILDRDSLVFEHDGRPFSESDIRAITDIGESSKPDDDDKIGRFGVGFKAVFAYTDSPQIWSPTHSFRIDELVLPYAIESEESIGEITRFKFPFNSPKKSPEKAYGEVEAGLSELREATLLFLNSLKSIKWTIQLDTISIHQVMHTEHHLEIVRNINGSTRSSSHFLKFDTPTEQSANRKVAIAFDLSLTNSTTHYDSTLPLSNQLRIVAAKPGNVSVYFPAEKENSGLRFHVHAPFVPELSRASIKETPANAPLFRQIAELTANSLQEIKGLDLLTVDFLGVLPNPNDSLDLRYKPIEQAIVAAMRNRPLTPTHSGTHAPSMKLRRARVAIKEVIDTIDLRFLSNCEDSPLLNWAAGAPLKNGDADRFLTSLNIDRWDIPELVDVLISDGGRRAPVSTASRFQVWMSRKSVDWHQALYSLLFSELRHRDEIAPLENARIALLSTGYHEVGSECFFPSESPDISDDSLHRVDARIYSSGSNKNQQSNSRKFLEDIGVRDLGEAEIAEQILKKRYSSHTNNTEDSLRISDLNRFITLVENQPKCSKLFETFYIFEGADGTWVQPNIIYIDTPFSNSGLAIYYKHHKGTNTRALSSWYASASISAEKIGKFAAIVGAVTCVQISEVSCKQNPEWPYLQLAPGDRVTSTSVDIDFTIPGLKSLLDCPSLECSRVIWRTLSSTPNVGKFLTATYKKNRASDPRTSDSQLVHSLKNSKWVPQSDGTFVLPSEASRELLPEHFPFDPSWGWTKALSFGMESGRRNEDFQRKRALAKELGFGDDENLQRARRFAMLPPDEQLRFLADFERRLYMELPTHESSNPDLRDSHVAAEAEVALGRETEPRMRSVSRWRARVKKEVQPFLRNQYTNSDQELICQICKDVMPFKLEDGNYYFESVQLLPELRKFHRPNYLALCPNHAAMFANANEDRNLLMEKLLLADTTELTVRLAGQKSEIHFTSTHLRDLRTVIQVESKEVLENTDDEEE